MDERIADAYVDTALGLSTALYATVLDYNKQHARSRYKLEPDWTWMLVGLGCGMCLAAAYIRVRLTNERGAAAERSVWRAVWRAFVVGGSPIAIWQVWRRVARLRSREDTLRHYVSVAEDLHAPQDHRLRSPAHLAPLRWPGQSTN